MKKLTGNQIRSMWLEFFKSKGHEIIPSASLIPILMVVKNLKIQE